MLIMKSRLSMEEFLVAGIQGAASVEQQVRQQDATSILSMVPLWNPSDDVCWRELMELGVDVLEMCLRMHQASVGKLATTSPFVIKIEAYLSAIAAFISKWQTAFTIFAVFLTMLETIYFMKSMQCSL
mmetsp:Transcript_1223/g.2256  ORF Transcript_1223/g.2256 Transcript_1223/m.2256 type:complete len:128 (-) Transcript_1223:71-454(-)